MEKRQTPNILYKYRNWDEDFHKNLILKKEIFFPSPKRFNDPFDCKIRLRYDLLTKEQLEAKIRFNLEPNLSPAEIENELKSLMQRDYMMDPAYHKDYQEDDLKMLENEYGVFSLSAINNNILMWSHYSNCHTGICIGFNREELLRTLKLNSTKDLSFNLYPVKYEKKYPLIIPNHQDSWVYLIDRLLYKYEFWLYEDEYRILSCFGGANKPYTLSKECFSEIIIGANMDVRNRLKIVELIKDHLPNVKIYQMAVSEDSFELIPSIIYVP